MFVQLRFWRNEAQAISENEGECRWAGEKYMDLHQGRPKASQ